MIISLLCPTRGRVHNMSRLWSSITETTSHPEKVELIFRLDKDDLHSILTADRLQQLSDKLTVKLFSKESHFPQVGNNWNDCWKIAKGEIFMLCGDDLVFETPGWDDIVRREFSKVPDRIILLYGQDGIQNERLATHGFLHKNWTDTVGYFAEPHGLTFYNDTWMHEISKLINRDVYCPELVIWHKHWSVGAPMDETYKRMQEYFDPEADKFNQLAGEREKDAHKLLSRIREFGS